MGLDRDGRRVFRRCHLLPRIARDRKNIVFQLHAFGRRRIITRRTVASRNRHFRLDVQRRAKLAVDRRHDLDLQRFIPPRDREVGVSQLLVSRIFQLDADTSRIRLRISDHERKRLALSVNQSFTLIGLKLHLAPDILRKLVRNVQIIDVARAAVAGKVDTVIRIIRRLKRRAQRSISHIIERNCGFHSIAAKRLATTILVKHIRIQANGSPAYSRSIFRGHDLALRIEIRAVSVCRQDLARLFIISAVRAKTGFPQITLLLADRIRQLCLRGDAMACASRFSPRYSELLVRRGGGARRKPQLIAAQARRQVVRTHIEDLYFVALFGNDFEIRRDWIVTRVSPAGEPFLHLRHIERSLCQRDHRQILRIIHDRRPVFKRSILCSVSFVVFRNIYDFLFTRVGVGRFHSSYLE